MNTLRKLSILGLALAIFAPSVAHAGGFWLTDRGVRPMSRGFAMVAGADDPQALWYNPAGLGFAGMQLQLDATYTFFDGTYARVDGGGEQMPEVDIGQVPLPIPGAAMSIPLGERFTLGLGVFAPNAILTDFDQYFDQNGFGQPCNPADGDPGCVQPQRYSGMTLAGTALANLAGAIAWRPSEHFAIGAGAHIMVGTFQADTVISACDGAICANPEDPEWDAAARLHLFPLFDVAPTAGITFDAGPLRFGGSFIWYPRGIRGNADMDVRLPAAQLFNGASVEGDEAKVSIDFPFTVRAGVELRPGDRFRMEAALVWERWSTQDAIRIEPRNMWIRDLVAIGDYQVGPVTIPRNMKDVFSVRLGGSVTVLDDESLVLSAGVNYENSAFDDAHLTTLTVDSDKLTVAAGLSFNLIDLVWFDFSYAHVFMADPNVTNSAVRQTASIRPSQGGPATPIGNGQYEMEANIIGAGLRVLFHGSGEPLPTAPEPELPMPGGEEESLDALGAEPSPALAPEPPAEPVPEPPPAPRRARRPSGRTAAPAAAEPAAPEVTPEPVGEEPPVERPRQPRRRRTENDPNPYR